MSSNKQYGLVVTKKPGVSLTRNSVFNQSDSEKSDEGGGSTDWVKKSLQKSAENSHVKRETKIAMKKALEQDSTVYQYDEVYDKMEQKKVESLKSKEKDKKPRFIQQLLETSEKRKREHERRIERQVQKEREAEGEQFKDKESFVTSSYKKKLEEFAKLDEEERRQEMLEEIGDVTKQEDISGFYRHLYQTTVSNKDDKGKEKDTGPEEKSKIDKESNTKSQVKKKAKDSRNYRKRKQSESSVDVDLDEDTSSSSSSSSSHSSSESDNDKRSAPEADKEKKRSSPPKKSRVDTSSKNEKVDSKSSKKQVSPVRTKPSLDEKPETKATKKSAPDLSIWQKRTVGPMFDSALKRYYERKATRQLTKG